MAKELNNRPAYKVVFERDDNNRWFVRSPEVPGAHSHGRTLAAARTNIRQAIALVLDLDEQSSFELVEEVRLPNPVLQELLDQARTLRDEAAASEGKARIATLKAIAESTSSRASLSMRDLADLLGLSHQRIQQLVTETHPKASRS